MFARVKRIALSLMACTLFTPVAYAAACDHYQARLDLEGKIGNKRNIGEAAVFLPIACTQDRLLFSDLRFRADNSSNREGNIGLGARVMHEAGIAGGYVYFDRKKSGESDKYYNQITTGAEWLAQTWETRANIYIPLNGKKTLSSGNVYSAPYLSGSGIYYDRNGFEVKEKPLYGADVEAGLNIPNTNMWIYGAGFSFHGDDAPSITGVRVRAKYDLTDNVALSAEGQYDDERGRQGWIGARLSIPFGKEARTQTALQKRMTVSPVRDVDIVTNKTTKAVGTPETLRITNKDSGDAQRILYVDNRASTNGDGSLENPYNNLAAAEAAQEDNDIIYIYRGDGTTTRYDTGFRISKANLQIIGEGSPLVFDNNTLGTTSNIDFNGHILRPAGLNPVITNAVGNHILHKPSSILNIGNFQISGLDITDAIQYGINIVVTSPDFPNQSVKVHNVNVSNSASHGIAIYASGNGLIKEISLEKVTANNNGAHGIIHYANQQSYIEKISLIDTEASYNDQQGITIQVQNSLASGTDGGIIDEIIFKRVTTAYNKNHGVRFLGTNTVTNHGVFKKINIDRLHSHNNDVYGVEIRLNGATGVEDFIISNSDISANNASHQIRFFDVATSTGIQKTTFRNNKIPGLTSIALNSGAIDARENWWGQTEGPLPSQITSNVPFDYDDWLTQPPWP